MGQFTFSMKEPVYIGDAGSFLASSDLEKDLYAFINDIARIQGSI